MHVALQAPASLLPFTNPEHPLVNPMLPRNSEEALGDESGDLGQPASSFPDDTAVLLRDSGEALGDESCYGLWTDMLVGLTYDTYL